MKYGSSSAISKALGWYRGLVDPGQEISSIEGVALRGTEAGVANDVPQFFLAGAVAHAGGLHDVFFEHDGAHVVTAKAQPELADLESLRDPACLHIGNVGEKQARNRQ